MAFLFVSLNYTNGGKKYFSNKKGAVTKKMSQPLKGSIEVEITSCLYFLIDRYFCPSFDSLSKNKDSCKSNEGASVKRRKKDHQDCCNYSRQ